MKRAFREGDMVRSLVRVTATVIGERRDIEIQAGTTDPDAFALATIYAEQVETAGEA